MKERIGRYRIAGLLGQGGMGVVYAAEDEVLRRRVAIKTLRPDAGDATSRARLWREARAAAGLAHPHICQVYDVGEDGEDLYVAMELLEGEALSEKLARGPLPLAEALRVACEVLEALTALHARAVVHRDLKPSNVFLTTTGSKLLDFGLALPLDDEVARTTQRLTQTGVLLGTPGFMAPEQWSGETVDARTDVFAAGALLVEMVTGAPAFQGKTPLALYHAVMHEAPPTLSGGPAVDALDRVAQRALARQPAERYESAAAMAADLRGVGLLVAGDERPTARGVARVLVLPFEQPRPDAQTDLLALGLSDALLSALAGRPGMVVRAGASPAPATAWAEVAAAHAARLLVTGTILHAGPQLRVTARLVERPGLDVVWSASVTLEGAGAFEEQEAVAQRIADAVLERTSDKSAGKARVQLPTSAEAYTLFLRANQLSHNFALLAEARDLYRAALELDPEFAPAWARLGRVLRVRAKYGHGDPDRDLAAAEAAFRRALDLEPDLAVAHNYYAYYEIEQLARPADAMKRLIEQGRRAPTDPDLFAGLVTACRFCGLLEPSVEADRRVRRLDPGMRTSVAYTHWMRQDFAAALLHDDEDMRWIHHYALPMLGRTAEALTGLRACEQRAPRAMERDMFTCTRATLEGEREVARAAAERILASGFRDPEGLYFMARNVACLAAVEPALEQLERVVAGGLLIPQVLTWDPWLAAVRDTPRFAALVARAQEGAREARDLYVRCGGPALLGPP